VEREHRGAAAADDHGKAAGGSLVRRAGFEEEDGEGGRELCAPATGGHRQRSGFEPVHPIKEESQRHFSQRRKDRKEELTPERIRLCKTGGYAFRCTMVFRFSLRFSAALRLCEKSTGSRRDANQRTAKRTTHC